MALDRPDSTPGLNEKQLTCLAEITEGAIRTGKIPGAVILIGNHEKILYRKAFGNRALVPDKPPMTTDTIFDLASLTKVIATTPAVMQLAEKGDLNLEDPVSKYWPEFKDNGKDQITVRDLLTHYSGLRAGLDSRSNGSGYETILKMILAEKPVCPPKTRFIYSDINFQILGELVQRISGQSLDTYCFEHIFRPLGMKDTGFNPPPELRFRIAPTQYQNKKNGKMLWGEVHDPTASCMGGVAGHAGLFSSADDLSLFAQMLLGGGSVRGVSLLRPFTIEKMTAPQTPPEEETLRGLGWDIVSPSASNGSESMPPGSYGHTGFTGASIWIDPISRIYIILLTNRVHPNGKGAVKPLRSQIASLVSSAISPVSMEEARSGSVTPTSLADSMKPCETPDAPNGRVKTGIDVLRAGKFAALAGLRVGLITNHTGIDSAGHRTLDLLHRAPNLKLAAIFCPEHGLLGETDELVPSSTDPFTRLSIHSLYGKVKRPTNKMLKDLDALIFDIQDAGARFYTYITTMGYAMEAAAKKGIPFYVLDRPNPITGSFVQGPILDKSLMSFTGYFPLPTRHGMTVGELARMFNVEKKIGARLRVIKMDGYKRTDWYDGTALPWVKPSPNLGTLTQAILYPGVAMVEGSNVSVGRGTDTPFELLGAPWISGRDLADYLNHRAIQGIRFEPADFTPKTHRYKNEACQGVRISLIDRQVLDSPALGIEIVTALHRLYPKDFQIDKTLIGSREVLQAIQAGQDPTSIVQDWQIPLEQFCKIRSNYLLY
jgi:uncharacterized protein YbbC (DUF1343 family)/CubicO group peptidase (beta-lactamase class C family)